MVNTLAYTFLRIASYTWPMPKPLADTLRAAIRNSGQSANAIARETGVPQPTITRFLAGADMKLATAEIIASYLGLELRAKKP
jgi:hypothetical protein